MTTTKWALDPNHSELGFKIKHLMISNVSGNFKGFNIAAETQDDDFTNAKVNVDVDVKSITTHNEQRDIHLLNSDFFEVETHPKLSFESTGMEKIDSETYALHGNLTMKGVTQPVKLNVEFSGIAKDPWGNVKAGFTVSGKISRKDFGMNFNAALETGGVMLGDEVKLNAEVQLVKQAASTEAVVAA